MSGSIDYYYSTRSIYAYFGAERIVALARAAGRTLVHKPVDLSRVVPASGSLAFEQRPVSHKRYFFGREIERWSETLGIPVIVDPVHHFGDRTWSAGFVIAAQQQGADVDTLHTAILRALWQDDRDLGDPQVLSQIALEAGLDPAPLHAAAHSAAVQATFVQNSEEAVTRGVFGSPTYIVDGDMVYGQDRLMMVERALKRPFKPAGLAPTW
jgi:2-hydroxychromene-2-carboxylate isomerase